MNEILTRYWPSIPQNNVTFGGGSGLGDIVRHIWEMERFIKNFKITDINFSFRSENQLEFFKSYFDHHWPQIEIGVSLDIKNRVDPWQGIGWRPLKGAVAAPQKDTVILHKKQNGGAVKPNTKMHNWSHRLWPDILVYDVYETLKNLNRKIISVDSKFDFAEGSKFGSFEDALQAVSDAFIVAGEVSFIHMVACCSKVPFFTIVQMDPTCTMTYPANMVMDLNSRTVILENDQCVSLHNLYLNNLDKYKTAVQKILQSQIDDFQVNSNSDLNFDLNQCATDVIKEHFDAGLFRDINDAIKRSSTDSPSTFVFKANSISKDNIPTLVSSLLAYVDLIDSINELCKTYRHVRLFDAGTLGSGSYDLYVQSNLPQASGMFTFCLISSDILSFKYKTIKEVR
jgi:hypothetical protein